MTATVRKPIGDITRGTTHPNRLRRCDRWVLHAVCPTIRAASDPLVVDLGYGASPITTVEMFQRMREHVRPDLEVVGIEIDPERVQAAQPLAQSGLSFHKGGFEIPLVGNRQPIMVRAFNVLRQYDEAEVASAWATVAARLAPQGFLIEGTCDELGRLSTWVAVRSQSEIPETFSMSMQLNAIDLPSDIAPRLPKALIHRNVPGERIHDLLSRLDAAWVSHAAIIPFGARQRWLATVESVIAQGVPVLGTKQRWRLGELTVPWDVVRPNK
jgi:hypothetical protein